MLALDTRNAEERDNLTSAASREPFIFSDECACEDVVLLASDRCGSLGRGCGCEGGLHRSARGPCDGGRLRSRCWCATTWFNGVAILDFSAGGDTGVLLGIGTWTSDEPLDISTDCGGRDTSCETPLIAS